MKKTRRTRRAAPKAKAQPRHTSRPRIPYGTILLSLAVVLVYAHLSGGSFYLADDTLLSLSFSLNAGPWALLSYQFLHVGVIHLLGNLLPLIAFGLILEHELEGYDVLAVFFGAGIVSSIIFSFMNPDTALVGASTGVAGLIGAAATLRPKISLSLLLIAPVVLYLAVFPAANSLVQNHSQQLAEQQQQLAQQVEEMRVQASAQPASTEVKQQLAATESRLVAVAEQKSIADTGRQREQSTPSDLSVHLLGMVAGILYVFAFRHEHLSKGAAEFRSIASYATRRL